MTMVDKPDDYPDFAMEDETDSDTGQLNVVAPPDGRKDSGWRDREPPPRQWFNWLHRITARWLRWLDENKDTLPGYNVDELPDADGNTGRLVYVLNETGGAVPAFSDGSVWRRVTDREEVSD